MIARVTGSGERISTYTVDDTDMAAGSTIGAPKGAIILKANGAIERFYSIDAGLIAIGGMQVRFWEPQTGVVIGSLPGQFVIHPDRQEHVYELSNGILIHETVLMLNGEPDLDRADPPIAYYRVELENRAPSPRTVASIAAAEMQGTFEGAMRLTYDARRRAFIASNAGSPDHARAFRCSRRPSHWEGTRDHGKCSRIQYPGPLADAIARGAGVHMALFEHRFDLAPGAKVAVTFTLAAASNGRNGLRRILDTAPDVDEAIRRTNARYERLLGRAVVVTPDPDVNRGVLWAKANMLRTECLSPTGWCFVNDPTRSNNSVARDTAWFAYGADYVTPDFARESLLAYVENLERKGLVVEYYDIRTGASSDYRLNINDDTPLIVLALWHHYNATADRPFLERIFPAARKAADYILAQRDARGLVWVRAAGTGDYGIAGWRNVIRGYRISGAVTEVNSECFAALQAVARMARALGRLADADRFDREALALRAAINEHLVDPETGLYYLTLAEDGTKRTDVTCDLVFPVMFGVADRERAAQIIGRLSVEPFWTEAGIRTVPRDDITYGPTHGFGLLGGVWVAVTFWYAFAAARFNPDFMASALRESFRHYSRDPRRNNTVPGQFSEWLHGETLTNEGMMLSPWFPPRYLWAAIEGAAGLDLSGDGPTCNPRLAPDWRWLGVQRLRFRGTFITWFVARTPELVMYATFRFSGSVEYHAYDRDASAELLAPGSDDVATIALARDGEYAILVGNTADRSVATSLRSVTDIGGTYAARAYSSMRGEWVDWDDVSSAQFARGIPLHIDRRGFCIIELRKKE